PRAGEDGQVEPPLHVARGAQAVDEEHRRGAAASPGVMERQLARAYETGFQHRYPPGRAAPGAGMPSQAAPAGKTRERPPLRTVTDPAPRAVHPDPSQTAAVRSSSPSTTSSSSPPTDHRAPNRSNCGTTTVPGTSPT